MNTLHESITATRNCLRRKKDIKVAQRYHQLPPPPISKGIPQCLDRGVNSLQKTKSQCYIVRHN